MSWALMAKFSTLGHSKTLEKSQIPVFSTLASTLDSSRLGNPLTSAYAQHRSAADRFDLCRYEAQSAFFSAGAEGCYSTLRAS